MAQSPLSLSEFSNRIEDKEDKMKTSSRTTETARTRFLPLLFALTAAAAGVGYANRAAIAQQAQKSALPVRTGSTASSVAPPVAPPISNPCSASGTTCTASISAPCSITTGGNYKLTGNVTESSTTVDAIEIKASHVTLDLNGRLVTGKSGNTCIGINACPSGTCNSDITLEDGSVTNFGGPGVQLGGSGNGGIDLVTGVHSYNNGLASGGGGGILLGDSSIALNDIVYCNGWYNQTCGTSNTNQGGDGLDCGKNCLLRGNVANTNFDNGISTDVRANVIFNSSSTNTTGINLGSGSGSCNNEVDGNSTGNINGGTATCTNVCNGSTC